MIIGITGKSGSGKSTLAKKLMKVFPYVVHLDIDKIGHEVLTRPEIIEEVIKAFGKDVIDRNNIDRKKLGDIVYASRNEMAKLSEITWKYMKVEIDKFIRENKDKIILLDWLLLPKTHHFSKCDIKILLDTPSNIRKGRAIKRDNITEEKFELREKASIDFNKNEYNYVITKDKDVIEVIRLLKHDLVEAIKEIKRKIKLQKKVNNVIKKFIKQMGYLDNEHVLGCFFYGSYLTGYNREGSDIDLHVIFDNSDPKHLIRANKYIDGFRVEYFEKPIDDLYLSLENDFNNQRNALLPIIGKGKIIFDKGGLLELKEAVLEKYSKPLPKLDENDAKEFVSTLNNRMEKVEMFAKENHPLFKFEYYATVKKIAEFYHRLNGLPDLPTSKIYRIYTDEDYRISLCKEAIPEQKFIDLFFDAAMKEGSPEELLGLITKLYNYSKRNVELDEKDYRILIKSRNENYRKKW